MDKNNVIECGGFFFVHNFDSGNLGHVERVPTELIGPWPSAVVPSNIVATNKALLNETPDYEFNLWTRPDCAGTEFENGNRTWFYFGVQASDANILVRLNLINLNKQGKMYNQGMAPVTRTLPGRPQWERIRDRPIHSTDDNTFTLSFKYRTSDNTKATTFFAFTYPFSFAELQIALNTIDLKMLPLPPPLSPDDIYYYRECIVYSLEGRRVDLLTITSHHGITTEREERLRNLFPDNQERPLKFQNKKVIFISARVHPGETPSSFVFNGFLNLLLNRHDPIAIQLRRLYVFKMIPFLNPDGVARGHYRTDTRGVNLNRVYLNPSFLLHPTVYASRALIRYYHHGCEVDDVSEDSKSFMSRSIQNISTNSDILERKKKNSGTNAFAKATELYKRPSKNRSITNIKNTDNMLKKDAKKEEPKVNTEATNLAEQVCDMTIREMPSQTSDLSLKLSCTNVEPSPSLLNDNVLRTCLGSSVHLSTSEELNFQGNNPLRPLRDTLKNSISLLMESNSSVTDSTAISAKESRLSNVKMGWCTECRAAVSRLEDSMPGLTGLVPGYPAVAFKPESPTYSSIEEYREHQKLQIDEMNKLQQQEQQKLQEPDQTEHDKTVYFCTNCFKRYIINESNEEICLQVMSERPASHTSVTVSAGDSGSVRGAADAHDRARAPAGSTGDQPTNATTKEDKMKLLSTKAQRKKQPTAQVTTIAKPKEPESGLYLYIDLHGHASKKGIFMYGNHFDDLESSVECMLLPRIMSLNNLHFHFSSCNFTERNMYLKDRRDGMSREGSGRVAVYKTTGLVRSYTLECNYNTGRLVNVLPPTIREGPGAANLSSPMPPKYTPHIFEEVNPFQVGRSLGASILDLTGQHPNSRIPCSEHRNLAAVRDWLRAHTRTMRPQLATSRLRPKATSPTRVPLYTRGKIAAKEKEERKENAFAGGRRSPSLSGAARSGHDILALNVKLARKAEAGAAAPRRFPDAEPKAKSLAAKRRNVLAIRKPNASKTQIGGVVKAKAARRSADDSENPRASHSKLGKRGFARGPRGLRGARCRAMASSSSDDLGGAWDEAPGAPSAPSAAPAAPAKRRPLHAPPAALLKKIRLKPGL
ncbi:cytosolic carboxypeptidase-like protein 5 isoform X3 [Hyposmocoma kahamanoa]|uniref:cytosolic carboxypeptidase-like protein 5 isoform X3 n=1 Tax=Hyposmocoma kahamanoa TaxID=1477025 RepID=UPI000E6D6B2D|nr:cytosolic carboxypeptidase-like protein 5 isoform X3 [Hyposmocoma kahamanoa]